MVLAIQDSCRKFMFDCTIKYLYRGGGKFVLLCLALILNHRLGYITLIGLFSIMVFGSMILKRRFPDITSILLLVYCVLYLLFSTLNGLHYDSSTLLLYGIAPFVFYEYGRNVVSTWGKEHDYLLFWLIITGCYCVDIFRETVSDISLTGEVINATRFFGVGGTRGMKLSATLVGLAMNIGMIGLPMFILLKRSKLRWLYLVVFLLSLLTTLHLLNRTGLVIMALCFLGVMGYYYVYCLKKPFFLINVFLFIVALVVLLIYTGVINAELVDFYTERNEDLYTAGSRTERWGDAFVKIFTHPLGWADKSDYYVHNMWLDIDRVAGIVPFLLLLWVSIRSTTSVVKLLKCSHGGVLESLILGLNICFFLSCFVEPIYGGTHFILYCMLWGFQNTWYDKSYIFSK